MSITTLPPAPLDTDAPATFASKSQALMQALPTLVTELNAIYDNVLIVQEQKTAGTAGGTASAGTSNTRQVGTTIINNIAGAVVDGAPNFKIQLPAGTYQIEAWGSAYSVGAHRIKIDTTGGTILGSSEVAGNGQASKSHACGRVTVTTGNVDFWHLVQNSIPVNGLGFPSSLGGAAEIYAQIKITKV